jgi:Holliday junction resolvasome RuvABC endonuclease subunit
MVILGADVSLNHAGFSILNSEGKQVMYFFISDVKKEVTMDPDHGFFMDVKKQDGEDPLSFQIRRVCRIVEIVGIHIHQFIDMVKMSPTEDVYVSLEGYAYGRSEQSNAVFQIAELTGMLKHLWYTEGMLLRIHDPASTKYFSVGKGRALKKEMVDAARAEGCEFNARIRTVQMTDRKTKVKFDEYDGVGTDVADAYFLARLVWTELQLRKGNLVMSDLSEHQILTFNRTTKSYPTNILARDFIQCSNPLS